MPSVSIIMPCYNSEDYIHQSIQSVINQTYQDWELIVIDNCSTDTSVALVESLAAIDNRIRIHFCKTPGAGSARNLGIKCSIGRFIAFLDADDYWKQEKLETQLDLMISKDVAFSWSAYQVIDKDGKHMRTQNVSAEVSYQDLLSKKTVIGCSTAIYDSETLGKVYMPNIKMRQDYALWLKILKICGAELRAEGLVTDLAFYRVHAKGLSGNKIRAAKYQWKVYREIEKLNFFYACYFFCYYVKNGLSDRS